MFSKKRFPVFSCLVLILVIVNGNAFGQQKQYGWIVPAIQKDTNLPAQDIAFIPDDGLNLYDKPNGEVIARLGRDPRMRNQQNYLLGIFLSPRDRTPELLPMEALAPLPRNCFAVPFVKQKDNFILLFDTLGPYYYWADVKEVQRLGYELAYQMDEQLKPNVINAESGAGLLIPDFEKLTDLPRQSNSYIPARGLTLYDKPAGKAVAKLSRFCPVGKFTDGNMRMFILPHSDPNNCKHITLQHLHHLSDDTYVIPFYNNVSGYVKLFDDPMLGPTWAKIDEFESQDYRLVGWKEYYIERRGSPAFANDPGLNLRESPYVDAKKIITINGDNMEITLIGFDGNEFCEGSWCKVKVKVYKQSQCTTSIPESENLVGTYEGWIKIVDDNGIPNVYINTKGC